MFNNIKKTRWEIKVGSENNLGTDQRIMYAVGKNLSAIEKNETYYKKKSGI